MDTRRLLLGDWTPWCRDGIDVARYALPLVGVVLLVTGGPAAVVLLVLGAAAVAARFALLPRLLDLAFVSALWLQSLTEAFGLYDSLSWVDRVIHVVFPLLCSPVLYVALARLDVVPDPKDSTDTRHLVGVGVVTFALGLAVGAVWEVYEMSSDALLGTELSESNADTVGDLVADAVGAGLGALLLVQWTRHHWGSVRRIPGVNTREQVDA